MPYVQCPQHPSSKPFDTTELDNRFEGIYCAGDNCGLRLGWIDTSHSDRDGLYYCDCCAHDLSKAEEEDDES